MVMSLAGKNAVARHQNQGFTLGQLEDGVRLAVFGVNMGMLKTEHTPLAMQFNQHGSIIGHHIAMLFASQFRNLAAGEVLVVRSNRLIASCAQDSLMRLVAAKNGPCCRVVPVAIDWLARHTRAQVLLRKGTQQTADVQSRLRSNLSS
jgi:hypothetical protein